MTQTYRIAVLPGDGIGPEVTAEALKVLRAVGERHGLSFEVREGLVGGAAYDATGDPLPPETLELARWADAILFGAVGGDKWDHLPLEKRPERGILGLRKELDLFANLRPVVTWEPLLHTSPLRPEILEGGVDILIVRELTGGLYFGQPKGRDGDRTIDTCVYTDAEIRRVLHVALQAARRRRGRVVSVDKANVMATSRRWRELAEEVAREYPDVQLSHMYVDNCAMQLIRNPRQFDVIVTENTFGDILTDEASTLAGSIGLLPSASLGSGRAGLYEPIHGTAPDIAGKGVANPLAAILCVEMLLRYSLDQPGAADAVQAAVAAALRDGYRTPDIREEGTRLVSTAEMGDAVVARLDSPAPR
ncbi:3-isopropylmalate dehydrogenase [Caldinitratiruptor microaerophilus]|uniref:3-isopropylmalate dehydrogenase n=1 Tax=Caldinitratiruptor microaerophilus TaxID=671077 RepID=A0AA35CLM8_9FIRM|nr:3-isopropylmalate dehydrogenase [Caldinitratiruptor microaerophilus]BDG60683.1 3-isopropylmalate dehydrogenase [Caldinitratiruptor microaerophilus]